MVVSSVICLEIERVELNITSVLLSKTGVCKNDLTFIKLLLFSGLLLKLKVVSLKFLNSFSSIFAVGVDDVVDGSVELVRSTMDLRVVITKSKPAKTLISTCYQALNIFITPLARHKSCIMNQNSIGLCAYLRSFHI